VSRELLPGSIINIKKRDSYLKAESNVAAGMKVIAGSVLKAKGFRIATTTSDDDASLQHSSHIAAALFPSSGRKKRKRSRPRLRG
jgi:hypothetical protein